MRSYPFASLLLMVLICLASRTAAQNERSTAAPNPTISGTVVGGLGTGGATVTAIQINPDGSSGAVLGSASTDANGNFSIILTAAAAGPIQLQATGGTYTSLFSGLGVAATSELSALLDGVDGNVSGVVISPLTEFVNSLANGILNGTAGGFAQPSGRVQASAAPPSLTQAHAVAATLLQQYAGLTPSKRPEFLGPAFTKNAILENPDGFRLGLFLGALSHRGSVIAPSSPDDMVAALSQDFRNGLLDGNPSQLVGTQALPRTAGTTDLLTSLNNYVQSGHTIAVNGVGPSDAMPSVATIARGVSVSALTPRAVGLTPGSSAALATLSFNGRQYLFIAGRTKGIVVFDVSDPEHIPPPRSWTFLATQTFQQNFVGGVVPVVGTARHAQVLAYAFALPHIALINAEVLATGTPGVDDGRLVDFETDLPLQASPPPAFSDGMPLIAGGIPDNGRKGVWLATADGYSFFDLSTNALGVRFAVAAGQQLAENIGGDIAHDQILAGNYTGIQLIELATQKSYSMDSAFFNANVAALAQNESVDANAVDTGYRVAIGTAEHVSNSFFIDLSRLNRNDANSTFVPQPGAFASLTLGAPSLLDLTGAAADTTSHLVLFAGDNTADVAVGALQDPASTAAAGRWSGLSDWIFYRITDSPSLSTYFGSSDPHVFGTAYNIAAGRPYGYLLDSTDTFVIQLDMQAFLNLQRRGTTGDDAHRPMADPANANVLTGIAIP